MSQKIRDLITIFLIQLVLTLPFYTAGAYGLTISNVKVTRVTSNSAAIEWLTDDFSNGKVRYGKTASLGLSQKHDNFIDNHSLNLVNGIDSDTTYFFSVESSDLAGNTTLDNNSNNFYTFKTLDITPPSQVTGLQALSKTSNSIFLAWDALNATDLSHYVIYRNRIAIGNSTTNSFNDTGVGSGSLNYKVSAVDTSGNEGLSSDTIIVSALPLDASAPTLSNVDALSITDTTARITWLTDENSTTIVFYGINKTDKTKSSSELVTNHSIVIDGLAKKTNYVFIAKSCDASNNCANLSKNFTAGKDTTLPFISLSTPRFVNRRIVDLIGSTEPFSQITLFVNDMNLPKRSLGNSEIGNSGKFVFSQVQLEQDNFLKLVAVDKSGNRNQKIFEVSVDTQEPIVQLDAIPPLTSKTNLSVKGFVNEQVLIKVFLEAKANESAVPSKITGFNATKIGKNFVELHWDESKDKDFSHYVVYREDASPIATTKPANFNLYIDALVDSGRSYTYQVSAVNIFANEGPKSEPITATTLNGGATLGIKPPDVDIFEDFRKPLMILNGSGSFNFGVKLGNGDGDYFIKLIFEDRAGNSVVIEKNVNLDTKKPEVKITSPPSGALIFENAANDVNVIGKTKPNARVHLFIDRTPFSGFNASLELSGMSNEIQSVSEGELDAKCRFNVGSKSFCKTGADFSETADEQGNFKFKNIDLTSFFGGAARLREVPATEFRDTRLEEGKDSKTTTLVVIATDATGQRGFATQRVNIGTCWSGNQSWDVIPLTRFQSPTFLSTERMAEGTETIYFYFNYSYTGRGTSPIITGISLSKACGTRELLDPRFNISCQIMPGGVPTKHLKLSKNEVDNTVSYSAAQLARFPGMDAFLEKDWKNFLKSINKELTFPVKVTIRYKHDTDNDGTLETETQTTCEQVSYVVDSTIIDPRKFLPDWLLFDFVDFLQSSIKSLTKVQEQIDKLVDFVAIGCLSSGGANLAVQVFRRWTDFWIEKTYALPLTAEKFNVKFNEVLAAFKLPQNQNEEGYCKDLIIKIREKKKGDFKLKYVNDMDLKKCFPASAGWWATESNTYSWMRWSCDRIFGHSAPAKWTETKNEDALLTKVQSIEGCPVDQSARGQPLRAERCGEALASFLQARKEGYNPDDTCFRLQMRDSNGKLKKSLFKLNQPVEGDVYELGKIDGPGDIQIIYAQKKDEFNYITAQSKDCNLLCQELYGGKRKGTGDTLKIEGKEVKGTQYKGGEGVFGDCTTVEKCTSFNVKDDADRYKYVRTEKNLTSGKDMETPETIKFARKIGYTSDCFYDKGERDLIDVVSDTSPSTREECCCISTKDIPKGIATRYYAPDDVDMFDTTKPVHEPKKSEIGGKTKLGANDYAKMEWSYRYSKEKFEAFGTGTDEKIQIHNAYHPHRYIEGRDKPACFGQNNILYDGLSTEDGKVLTVDPFKDHWAAFQCVHLAGISNRIQFLKNLMTSLSTCLIQVRTNGRGDSGACKELFTQYLCGAIWQLVRFLVDKGCATSEFGQFKTPYDEDVLGTIRGGAKSVYDSISDLQTSITQEYGNAKLNEILGTGEESVARKVCLAAFGYDWHLNIKDIVDAAYTTPFATLVQPITRSREFLTVDPVALKPKYEYRASWIINPGCDFERYDVYLSCVGRKQLDLYPNSINCGAVGAPSVAYSIPAQTVGLGGPSAGYSQCDCLSLPDEKLGPSVFSGRLKQNVLEDSKAFHNVLNDNFRYDHLKFVLRADRKIPSNIKPNCFPQGYDDGVFYFPLIEKAARDISYFDCRVDLLSGVFGCGGGAQFGRGTAEFIDVSINGENAIAKPEIVVDAGQTVKIDTTIRNVGQNKCLIAKFDGQVLAEIVPEGTQQYSIQTQPTNLGTKSDIQPPSGIQVQKISLTNTNTVSINVRFYDISPKDKPDGIIRFEDDLIEINGEKFTVAELGSAKKVRQGQVNEAEVSYADGRINIRQEKAEIQIISAELLRGIDGKAPMVKINYGGVDMEVGTVFGTIQISKPQEANAASQLPQQQPKTLTIALYHTNDVGTDLESCNQNEPVLTASGGNQERNFKIIVQQKPTSSAKQAPLISGINNAQKFRKDPNPLIPLTPVKVTITHKDGIQTPQLDCKAPDGRELTRVFGKQGINVQINDWLFDINSDELKIGGKYTCTLTAQSKNSEARPNPQPVSFEVECGDKDNGYGVCRDACFPPAQAISSTQFDCGQEVGVCCNK